MAKMVLFSPREEMIDQARHVMQRLGINDVDIKLISSSNAVDEAQKALSDGVDIIIARGNHASLIRRYTNIPTVEIVLTAQEMGILITKAKTLLNKENPIIGVVGFGNMFCDMRFFDEIFQIRLKTYYVNYTEELKSAVDRAAQDGVDIVTEYANDIGVPNMFLSSGEDSIQQALRVASSVAYASDLEKKNSAELRTLLDFSFNGIIKLSSSGEILVLNHIAENLLNKNEADVIGQSILDLFPSLDQYHLDQVLKKGQEVFSTFLVLNGLDIAVNLAPIKLGNQVEGAILSCHEIRKLNQLEAEARRELYVQGRIPKYNFEWIQKNLRIDAEFIKKAKRYAQSNAPLLINGESDVEGEILAQSIHNDSLRKTGPYVSARCAAYDKNEQLTHLFGSGSGNTKNGVISDAHGGTLFIDEISELSPCAQYRLYKLISEHVLIRDGDNRPLPVNIRIITATEKNLWCLVEEGKFRKDLYYAVSTLTLSPVPLRERKDEIGMWIDKYIKEYSDTYSRYIVLTKGARTILAEYPWDGNFIQLRGFCENLVLSSMKRSVDEIIVSQMLNEAYPVVRRKKPNQPIIVYKDPEAAYIAELLEKHDGNRSLVANEMNISTTTLWRKIKKHKISGKFEA